jgi:muramoyltetrapeptide carboxypeptidase LdcA involved in peptidoglycan recycling
MLERRARPIAVFGFSELTTLVNIVGALSAGVGVYDMGPAFLSYGLKRAAAMRERPGSLPTTSPGAWMLERLRPEFDAFFHDVTAMIEGRGTARPITARLARGEMPDRCAAVFVGGNLTVLSTLVGSEFENCVKPAGRWLVLEDFNDKLERVDRFLAHLTLSGYWHGCEGLLLGDFHKGYEDLTPSVLELLKHHIPRSGSFPILTTQHVGHIWPMSPLPLHTPTTIERSGPESLRIRWPGAAVRVL